MVENKKLTNFGIIMNIYEFSVDKLDLKNKIIFDCAIGAGESTYYWAKAIHEQGGSSKIIGFDNNLSGEDRNIIHENLKDFSQYVEVKNGDISDLNDYKNNSVDYINCDDTVVFLANTVGLLEKSIKEFHRLLKPGGKIVINSEIPVSWNSEVYIQNQYRRWNFAKAILAFKGEIWSIEPSCEEIKKIVIDNGFVIEKEKMFQPFKQHNPTPCINEWYEIMRDEINLLKIGEKLKIALLVEASVIRNNVLEKGMACPAYFAIHCMKS
ncbi:MAG: class I SAM-dependent methyltransferase [Candidatus Delongbacteria bacterium]|nr:class I SAM-dependent methyltransferase [Candidatus Delongbacteria bacterium]MCG2760260.1 class I SAM-dependent methyltransferase [Candidatus Delongbacteria bacterium]